MPKSYFIKLKAQLEKAVEGPICDDRKLKQLNDVNHILNNWEYVA